MARKTAPFASMQFESKPMPTDLSRDETRAWLTLLRAPGLGPMGLRELLARHAGAAAIMDAARNESCIPETARAWLAAPDAATVERDLAWLEGADHHLIVWGSDDYPALL